MATKRKLPRWLTVLLLVVLFVGGIIAWKGYQAFLGPSVTDKEDYLYIHTNDDYQAVLKQIEDKGIVDDITAFDHVAQLMKYPQHVKPGRYKLTKGMGNRRLIGNLRGGFQEAVSFRFSNVRLKETFAGLLGSNFEADSLQFINLLNDDSTAKRYGFTTDNFYTMFIPNTYDIYWNTTAEDIITRFHNEYQKFWTTERLDKAKALNLTPVEVSILASIVRGEALHTDEMPAIAGLYLNRLAKGMLLQADPTVIFANNDFTIRRVLNRHLTIDNPYNTYRYKGLPPGPINMPPIVAIDAVLNPQKHNYIYMCAKEDFSGYHSFATTVQEHLVNARKFQKALDERNIKK